MTTAADATAAAAVDRYVLRVAIEERHRHIKCFWDIADFKSTDLDLVVNQVVFTLLTYTRPALLCPPSAESHARHAKQALHHASGRSSLQPRPENAVRPRPPTPPAPHCLNCSRVAARRV